MYVCHCTQYYCGTQYNKEEYSDNLSSYQLTLLIMISVIYGNELFIVTHRNCQKSVIVADCVVESAVSNIFPCRMHSFCCCGSLSDLWT